MDLTHSWAFGFLGMLLAALIVFGVAELIWWFHNRKKGK